MKKTEDYKTNLILNEELEKTMQDFLENVPHKIDNRLEEIMELPDFKKDWEKIREYFGSNFEEKRNIFKKDIVKHALIQSFIDIINNYNCNKKQKRTMLMILTDGLLCKKISREIVYLHLLYVEDNIKKAKEIEKVLNSKKNS